MALTEQQKINFNNLLRAWLNQDQSTQETRFTILKNLLTEDQLSVFYKQIATDLFIQADVALAQMSQQKTALEAEKNSVVIK